MIPWFIVNIIGAIASLFGRDTYVTATHGSWRWGADRIHFTPIVPGVPRPRKLAPYRGGPLQAGQLLSAGIDITNDRIEMVITDWGRDGAAWPDPASPTGTD